MSLTRSAGSWWLTLAPVSLAAQTSCWWDAFRFGDREAGGQRLHFHHDGHGHLLPASRRRDVCP